ncbi:MAG: N-acetylmuramoyl-L-alanine amidase [Planctomycetes bacterium]|nr:N-acetylmuramoyl-L-alanine amidase [Planctomycetota bacterium]
MWRPERGRRRLSEQPQPSLADPGHRLQLVFGAHAGGPLALAAGLLYFHGMQVRAWAWRWASSRSSNGRVAAGPRARPQAARTARLLVGVCTSLWLWGCAGPSRAPQGSYGAPESNAGAAAASDFGASASDGPEQWRYEPLSWAKLERIERWLDGPGAGAAEERAEAEIELATGLVEFAREERVKLGEPTFEQRLDRSEDLLQSALGSGALSTQQRERATAALTKVLLARLGDPLPPPTLAQPDPAAPEASGFPELITRAKWGARPANRARLERHNGPWERLTIHHSADINGELAEQSAKDSALALRKIQRFHLEDKRWGDIGYHFLIDPLGRIYEGRSLQWQGAHAGNGDLNHRNIGVCLLGQYLHEAPPPEQLHALDRLVDSLRVRYKIPVARIKGHLELHGTDCPGPYLLSWVKRYRASGGAADPGAPLSASFKPEPAAPKPAKNAAPQMAKSGAAKSGASKAGPSKSGSAKTAASKPGSSGVQ